MNVTATTLLGTALHDAAASLEVTVQQAVAAAARAGGARGAGDEAVRSLGAACTLLEEQARLVAAVLAEIRASDGLAGVLVWQSADHPSWHAPASAIAAAQRAATAMAAAFEWGLGDGATDELLGILRRHDGDPVFAMELLRVAGGSSAGFGAALWAASVAPRHQRHEVGRLFQALGDVVAMANRAAPALHTYGSVMRALRRSTGGDAAAFAQAPLIFLAARPFTATFLEPAWRRLVLDPNRGRQRLGRSLPAAYVHDGAEHHDVRSLVLRAVARNPVAAARFLGGRDEHGRPNLHGLLGPGVMDGDDGRALALVVRSGTRAVPAGLVGAWTRVSDEARVQAADAVVSAFAERAPHLGWRLPEAVHPALEEVAIAHLESFRLVPPSFRALPLPPGAELDLGRDQGLRFLSLLFTRRSSEDVVVVAAERHVQEASADLAPDDHAGHLDLGLLWGALTDATVSGRLLAALHADRERDEDRAAWELGQSAVSTLVGFGAARRVPGNGLAPRLVRGAVRGTSGGAVDSVGTSLEDRLLPDEQHTEEARERAAAVVRHREEAFADLFPALPGSIGWSAALSGFQAGVGPNDEPAGYREPGPAVVITADTVVDGVLGASSGDAGAGLDAVDALREALDPPARPRFDE